MCQVVGIVLFKEKKFLDVGAKQFKKMRKRRKKRKKRKEKGGKERREREKQLCGSACL